MASYKGVEFWTDKMRKKRATRAEWRRDKEPEVIMPTYRDRKHLSIFTVSQ